MGARCVATVRAGDAVSEHCETCRKELTYDVCKELREAVEMALTCGVDRMHLRQALSEALARVDGEEP